MIDSERVKYSGEVFNFVIFFEVGASLAAGTLTVMGAMLSLLILKSR